MISLLIVGATMIVAPIQDPVSTVFGTRIFEKTTINLEDDELAKQNWQSLYAIREQGQRRFSSSIFKETIAYRESRGLHKLKSGVWLYVPQNGHGLLVDYHWIDFNKVAILPLLFKSNFKLPKPGVGRFGDLSPLYKEFFAFSFGQKFSNYAIPSGSALDDLPCMCTIRNEVTFGSGGQVVTFSPTAQSPSRRTKEDRVKEDEIFKGKELQLKYKLEETQAIAKAIFTDPSNPGRGLDFHSLKTKSPRESFEESVQYSLDQVRDCLAEARVQANELSKNLVENLKLQFPEVFGPYQMRKKLSDFPKEMQDSILEGLKSESGGPATDEQKESFRNSAAITSTRISLGIYLAVAPRGNFYGTDIWLN